MLFSWVKKEYAAGGIVVCALLAGFFFVFYFRPAEKGIGGGDARASMPDANQIFALVLSDLDGNPVRLEDYRGRNVVIALWASWSPYSAADLLNLSDVSGEYGDRIVAIAVNRGEPREIAHTYLEQVGAGGNFLFLLDRDDALFKAIRGFSMPEAIFIDAKGEVRFHKRGAMTHEELRRRMQDLFGL